MQAKLITIVSSARRAATKHPWLPSTSTSSSTFPSSIPHLRTTPNRLWEGARWRQGEGRSEQRQKPKEHSGLGRPMVGHEATGKQATAHYVLDVTFKGKTIRREVGEADQATRREACA